MLMVTQDGTRRRECFKTDWRVGCVWFGSSPAKVRVVKDECTKSPKLRYNREWPRVSVFFGRNGLAPEYRAQAD